MRQEVLKVKTVVHLGTVTHHGKEVGTQPTMDKKSTPAIKADEKAFVADVNRSTAARIKFLAAAGYSRADIARAMTQHSGKAVSYQWVKNVLDKVAQG